MASHPAYLAASEALREQDRRFARAFSLLEESVRQRVFPGAALAVIHNGKLAAWRGVGRFTYAQDLSPRQAKYELAGDPDRDSRQTSVGLAGVGASPSVMPSTVFDLASLTKVIATTAMAMILYERGQLALDRPVADILPEFLLAADGTPSPDQRRRQVTIRMLLAHSSGLADYEKFFLRAHTREELVHLALTAPLAAPPMTRACYSDIGFIVLGELLVRLAGEPLDSFCEREIFRPLRMSTTRFCPPPEWKAEIPPTADDRDFRRRVVQGEVHDENASVMGGISAHAGLFANALDIAQFAHCMLSGGAPILTPTTVALFTRRESVPAGTSRTLGWDTPSAPSQSGRYFSPASFGHLGYTGTSLWCDPERRMAVILLTNRTWPDVHTAEIKRVRPLVHDAVVEALQGSL